MGFFRRRVFAKRRKFSEVVEQNQWLADHYRSVASEHSHPELSGQTMAEVFAAEQASPVRVKVPFDGYQEIEVKAAFTSLVSFDRIQYSVHVAAAGKPVMVRAYADRLIIVYDGKVVGVHFRQFGRDRTLFDPWHYLEVLRCKPEALRNGCHSRIGNCSSHSRKPGQRWSAVPRAIGSS